MAAAFPFLACFGARLRRFAVSFDAVSFGAGLRLRFGARRAAFASIWSVSLLLSSSTLSSDDVLAVFCGVANALPGDLLGFAVLGFAVLDFAVFGFAVFGFIGLRCVPVGVEVAAFSDASELSDVVDELRDRAPWVEELVDVEFSVGGPTLNVESISIFIVFAGDFPLFGSPEPPIVNHFWSDC